MLPPSLSRRTLTATLIGIAAISCSPQPTPAPTPISSTRWPNESLTVLYRSDTSAMKEEIRLLVRSDAQWPQVWANVVRNPGQTPAPKIDFRTQMVFIASLGSLNQGSPGIQLDSVAEYKEFVVIYTSAWRGMKCETEAWDVRPVTVIKMPNTYKPVVFTDTPKVLPKDRCGTDSAGHLNP